MLGGVPGTSPYWKACMSRYNAYSYYTLNKIIFAKFGHSSHFITANMINLWKMYSRNYFNLNYKDKPTEYCDQHTYILFVINYKN